MCHCVTCHPIVVSASLLSPRIPLDNAEPHTRVTGPLFSQGNCRDHFIQKTEHETRHNQTLGFLDGILNGALRPRSFRRRTRPLGTSSCFLSLGSSWMIYEEQLKIFSMLVLPLPRTLLMIGYFIDLKIGRNNTVTFKRVSSCQCDS